MMKFPIIKYKQNNHDLISTVLPFNVINTFSHVLIYDQHEGGYQRAPDIKHYSSIKNYVLGNLKSSGVGFIFPTSIILGIDEGDLSKVITSANNMDYLNLDLMQSHKLFRIIDGQHRLKGLEEAAAVENSINDLKLSVVILVTPPKLHSIEMQIFSTINSKSKRIKIDLIELASFEYNILENNIQLDKVKDHISIQIAHLLNEDSNPENKWYNAIKFGIHEEQKVGIIGVTAFKDSILMIVSKYLATNEEYKTLTGSDLILFSKTAAIKLKSFIQEAWLFIYRKWPESFGTKSHELDFDFEIKEYYYKNDYYIQKTLGTKSLNYLLRDVVNEENDFLYDKSLEIFGKYIVDSQLLTSDWKVGNTFSGYSSESAFGKVSKMIKGAIPIPRN